MAFQLLRVRHDQAQLSQGSGTAGYSGKGFREETKYSSLPVTFLVSIRYAAASVDHMAVDRHLLWHSLHLFVVENCRGTLGSVVRPTLTTFSTFYEKIPQEVATSGWAESAELLSCFHSDQPKHQECRLMLVFPATILSSSNNCTICCTAALRIQSAIECIHGHTDV